MRQGFGSIHSASGMKKYLDKKIKSEIERNRPSVRTATVVGIDRSSKKCEIRYPGEEGTVRVPYGSAEPSDVGARVKVDGPVGGRRIVDVIGETRLENRIDKLESQEIAAPLWGQSMQDYAETFPLSRLMPHLWRPPSHNNRMAHCSPLIIPRDMYISRIEVKARERPTSNLSSSTVRLALHKVDRNERDVTPDGDQGDISFNLRLVAVSDSISGNVDEDSHWRYGYTLPTPHTAKPGEIYTISYASYNNSTSSSNHPRMELFEHPTLVQTLGENQFCRGWYNKDLITGDVMRNQINTRLTRTIWAAAFPLPPGEGYIDSGGDEGE